MRYNTQMALAETIAIPEPEVNLISKYSPYVFVDNGSKIMYIDPDVIATSRYCNKNNAVLKKEAIANMKSRTKTKRLQCIPDNTDILVVMLDGAKMLKKSCDTLHDFYNLLVYLDKYCFSIEVILTMPMCMTWLNKIKNISEQEWDIKENADIILGTAEYRFTKHAFPTDVDVPVVIQPAGYPGELQQPLTKPGKIQLPYNDYSRDEIICFEAVLSMLCKMEIHDPFCSKLIDDIIWTYATSIRDCHMILATENIASIVVKRKNTREVLHYLFKILYADEMNIKSNLRDGHRIIIVDGIIPSLAHILQNLQLESNPLTLMNGSRIKHKTGMVLPGLLIGKRGIHKSHYIKERINIYTCGYLQNFNWEKTALCGSCIPATSIINPLEKCHNSYDDYLQHYYPSIKINAPRMKYSFALRDQKREHIETLPQTDVSDIDIMIETTDDGEFDKICQRHFGEILRAIEQYHLPTIGPVKLERVETENKYKYVVHGLQRPLEMFSVNSIPGVINKFHLSCVRGWFDGNHLNMLPSFIATAYTGINLDIRWISCNKDIRATIIKYFRKGFGIYLNKSDRENIKVFIETHDEYRDLVFEAPVPGWRGRRRPTVWFSNIINKVFELHSNPSIDREQLRQTSYLNAKVKNIPWMVKNKHIIPKIAQILSEMNEYFKVTKHI